MSTNLERRNGYVQTLLAPITLTAAATGNSQTTQIVNTVPVGPVTIKDPPSAVAIVVDVSAVATIVSDTCDITVQTLIGGFWVDVMHATQILGNGSAIRFVASIAASAGQAMFATSTALTAGNVRNLIGDSWAVKWVLSGTGSFTLSVTIIPE